MNRVTKYFRVRLANSSGSTSTVVLQTILSETPKSHLTTNLSSTITDYTDAEVTRSIVVGRTDGGTFKNAPVDVNGHPEVVIHGPLNPFGSLNVAFQDPVFQYDAVYGINSQALLATQVGTGTVTATNSSFLCQTGATIYSAASLSSYERMIYRPGQGVIGRFAALWSDRVESSYTLVGYGHPEDGVYIGYVPNSVHSSTEFGLLHTERGVREVQTPKTLPSH
jgi:hypothetical protein